MNYIIQTQNARKLKEEILNSVASKADVNGNGIVTWQCVETDGGDKVLVLTEGQWAEKGCLSLAQVVGRNELQVRYLNWGNGVERNNGDDKYMFGRFTELILTHFTTFIDRVIIE
jgi:coproporphyrinogen III oxidase